MTITRLAFALMAWGALASAPLRAGHLVSGHVSDAWSGEPLPVATVQIAGTYQGTIANHSGDYLLELTKLPATLRVTYVGYRSRDVVVPDSTVAVVDFALEPVPYKLPATIVTPEDLAVRIMREVMRRKQVWRPTIQSYKANAYLRIVVESKGEIALMGEVVSDIFWDQERGLREVIKSQRVTDNIAEDGDDYSSALDGFVNLYDDNIPFLGGRNRSTGESFGHSIIGPTHPDALSHYRFKVTGQRYLDDRIVYDISVRPRNKLQTAFEGRVAVLDEEFALLEVELSPNRSTLVSALPVPIVDIPEFSYQQQFRDFGGVWLPVDYRTSMQAKIDMVGLSFPLIQATFLTRLTNYEVNIDVPDSIYAGEELQVDTLAVEQDSLFNTYLDRIPLTAREVEAYETLDSTWTPEMAFKPTGFLTRFMDFEDGDEDSGPKRKPIRQVLRSPLLS